MATDSLTNEDVKKREAFIKTFFPDIQFRVENSRFMTSDGGEFFFDERKIIAYLQTMFFEEHLVEVLLDFATRKFFTTLVDDLPPLEEEENGEVISVEPDYEPGAYLKDGDNFLLTPLTPGIGNAIIRKSKIIIVSFFTGTTCIQLGSTFLQSDSIRDIPALRLKFPSVGLINRGIRAYRVKTLSSVDAKVIILEGGSDEVNREESHQLVDISSDGLGFQVLSDVELFQAGEQCKIRVLVEGLDSLDVGTIVRHISKSRAGKGYKIICGMQFDLESRAVAANIEKLTAAIQRLHLRELAEKTSELSGVCILRQ